jgi:hypothetical protein
MEAAKLPWRCPRGMVMYLKSATDCQKTATQVKVEEES